MATATVLQLCLETTTSALLQDQPVRGPGVLLGGCPTTDSTEPPASHCWSCLPLPRALLPPRAVPAAAPAGVACPGVKSPVLSPGARAAASSSLGWPGSFISSGELGSVVKDGAVEQLQSHVLFAQWHVWGRS